MSDLSTTIHNLEDLLSGKTDFNGFVAGEVAIFKKDVAQLSPPLQAAVSAGIADLEVGASALVGIGKTAIGPILAQSSDDQATMLLNLLGKVGVPTTGVLSIPEHAALQAVIDGLKAGLDRMGIKIATAGVSTTLAKAA